ncbi:uncharacterized protein LOC131688658 isoform X2 [Topomyia yanbarensis]|uniref:uncharacterized protein LOC131688658 isoform X2 n=1 Tax=Topomyia yanbarensis TaxID=2498891 RepID=UPI00273A7B51|nr:uncharacterized protein LOC131688658 isoform X2 [Topomyia yanbarensis]
MVPSVGRSPSLWFLIGFLLCLPWMMLPVCGVTIFPSDSLTILQGAGFLAYLIPSQVGDPIKWSHCSVTVVGNTYSLDTEQVHVVAGVTKVQRFSADVCGIRVENVQKAVEHEWILSAMDTNSKNIEQKLMLSVNVPKQIGTLNVTISDTTSWYTLQCPQDSSIRYCRILDQAGNIYNGCSRSFDVIWESARFRCRILYWGSMDEIETIINVSVEKSKRDVTMSLVEDDSRIILTCQYKSRVSPCRAVSVDSRRQMMLLDGHLADRYSAYDTQVSSGVCSLEIRKPLHPEDYGVWRIFLELSTTYSGCVFNIGKQLNKISEKSLDVEADAQLIEIFADLNKSFMTELNCDVPYPLDYCYLSGPQGGNYEPYGFDNLKTLGMCQFKVENITTGKWACGMNDLSGGLDRMSYFDVRVYNQPGKAITPLITGSTGDEGKKLLCRTILNMPIEICRFVSPTGDVHGLSENIVPGDASRFRYYGEGLRAGECGLEIIELEREDFGRWMCSIRVQNKDYAIYMDVVEEGEDASILQIY